MHYKSTYQVDYVIPILTRQYIEKINNPAKTYDEMHNSLDTKYLKYIYSLLRYEYVRNQCCNNRVRYVSVFVPTHLFVIAINMNVCKTDARSLLILVSFLSDASYLIRMFTRLCDRVCIQPCKRGFEKAI